MDYLALVNKVIQESGSEQDELTLSTWSSAEVGRRIYPRIKRNVAEAWKMMQIERNEWEFQQKELSTLVRPNFRFVNGNGSDPTGLVFRNPKLFGFTVDQVVLESGTFAGGDAAGIIYFTNHTGTTRAMYNDLFTDVATSTITFNYLGPTGYDFDLNQYDLGELEWDSFTAYHLNGVPIPIFNIPYDHSTYEEYSFNTSTNSVAQYVSQGYDGKVLFYPQILTPFRIKAIYSKSPQNLVLPTDVPEDLPLAYHEWIAWRGLMMFAAYDKNPALYAYANQYATFYKNRAEKNLMPNISWASSSFDE